MGLTISEDELLKFANKISFQKKFYFEGIEYNWWFSQIDGSFLSPDLERIEFLFKTGITEKICNYDFKYKRKLIIEKKIDVDTNKSSNIGFNPAEQKWYGWSHRAMFGFGIGSKCKKGDCHYNAPDKKSYIDSCVDFWKSEYHVDTKGFEGKNKEGDLGVYITWIYNNKVPNERLRGKQGEQFSHYPERFGRGEWIAKTLEDARIMACDFAKGVS